MHVPHKKRHSYTRKHIQKTGPSVVVVGKIFAHWCGHCQTLLPEWKKLIHVIDTKQKINKSSNTEYKFVDIEQSKQADGIARVNRLYLADTGHQLAIQGGFPTLFKITDGTLEYYNGPRRYLEMLRWYMSHSHQEKGGDGEPAAMFAGKRKTRANKKRHLKTRSRTKSTRKGLFSFLF
jgi:thiol-disulfide isomerase/thioredoxin